MNKKIIILMLSALTAFYRANAQADPAINVITNPGSIANNTNGQLQVSASNQGSTDIVANSLEITLTAGTNAEIISVQAGSDTRWSVVSLTTGTNNTMKLRNNAIIFGFDGGDIDITIKGKVVSGSGQLKGSIVYLPGANPLLAGNAQSSSQGNGQLNNDSSSTSLIVTGTPLAVNLIGFKAYARAHNAEIEWSTANEQGVTSYTIERSEDGKVFSPVATIAALHPQGKAAYNKTLEQDATKSYYRIAVKQADGSVGVTAIISVIIDAEKTLVNAYPNPFSDFITVTGVSDGDQIMLYNAYGRLLDKGVAQEGVAMFKTANLPGGSYYISVMNGDEPKTFSFVKAK